MAGFWHLSHHQMRDLNGAVYAGAKAYFYEAATLLSIVTYQDYGLGTEHPNPVQANAYGVFPPVFFDEEDGFYRQRITSSGGVIIPGTDVGTLPIIGPGEGGGGSEVPVDPNALFQTGDVIWQDQSGTRSGWVRDNGRSVGSATSGATERANSDCEALFTFLYGTYSDTICPVNGGRTSVAADWAANKYIGTPDKRGYVPGGLDDMGNSAAGRFASVPVVLGSVTAAGSVLGAATHTLATSEIPAHSHTLTITQPTFNIPSRSSSAAGGGTDVVASNGSGFAFNIAAVPVVASNVTMASAGGGGVHNNVQGTVLGTYYRKL